MALDAQAIAAFAGRPPEALTRRDVARALLQVRAAEAADALPAIRRQLIAAGNPLSAAFWDSATATLHKAAESPVATADLRAWLEATGTEPAEMLGMLAWDDAAERSELQTEMYDLLVAHLEEMLAAGLIDPDALARSEPQEVREHRQRQEEWMLAPLPDGRVPMWAVLDESDAEFEAEWSRAEANALAELRENLSGMPPRRLPAAELQSACQHVRAVVQRREWPHDLLIACGGLRPRQLPRADQELWLQVAAGIVAPKDDLPGTADPPGPASGGEVEGGEFGDGELSADEQAMIGLSTLDHYDWLAVATALARGGPGTPADPASLGRYVADYDPDDPDDQADAAVGMFQHVVELWRVLGAVDAAGKLTELGWWGIPEAVQRAWQPPPERAS